ncbi:MAG: Pycsar system effector family protein [Candidatus Neomarinimicrobiota bacterium]
MKQTRNHHVQLSFMADSKANMLLTISSVVITLTVPHMMTPGLKYGAMILIVFCLLTIILSTYAVMPKLPIMIKNDPTVDINSPRFNLLFFGDFVKMSFADFEATMEDVLNEPGKVYEVMTREIYTLGYFLAGKKYRYIRLAYGSFIIGIFTSVIVTLFTNRGI